VLAADHRARGVMTVERYRSYVDALAAAMPHCDGILASYQPLSDLCAAGAVGPGQRTYLSINRTGLAGSVFELDDRLVARVATAAERGWTGVKHMTRIDLADPVTASALELLGSVLDESRAAGLEAMIEAVTWRDGKMAKDTDAIVYAAVVAHDIGAPLLKVPVPEAEPGPSRIDAVARVVESVGVPVLFLGGPRSPGDGRRVLDEARDVVAGGGAGMAVGRTVFEDPDPGEVARLLAGIVGAGSGGGGAGGGGGGAGGGPRAAGR
jgi:DhnA family fructose-bisphosphate aldolase class Ia